jgi:hypothetical protein
VSDDIPAAHLAPEQPKAPIEAKVLSAFGGSLAGPVIAGLIIGLLDDNVYTRGPVPDYLSGAIVLAVTGGLTLFAGWRTQHTPRPDLTDKD